MPLFYEKKQLVAPGDLLAEGDYVSGDSTYKENKKIYASRLGLVDYNGKRVHVVALKAFYIPVPGDTVIGKVAETMPSGWIIDIKAPHPARLRASDVVERSFKPETTNLPSIFDVGDLIIANVVAYDRTRDPQLTVREPGLGKIVRGQLVEVTPTKIPRIIGRQGSMVGMLKRETGCQLTIGQNGLILISGRSPEAERLAVMALRKIEKESHTSGLTERVTEMIRKERKAVESN
ncbi:MAG: RNA-binding protein [Candidatus Heimdallarchaeota archaeon]|nr:RNA-binding protein [Candidatus Heimdallarchaeota archaeon]